MNALGARGGGREGVAFDRDAFVPQHRAQYLPGVCALPLAPGLELDPQMGNVGRRDPGQRLRREGVQVTSAPPVSGRLEHRQVVGARALLQS